MTIGLKARLAALHAANFAGVGVHLPFFPVWLESRAFDAATIGAILALPILVRVLVTAPLLSLTDRALGPRALVVAGQICAALAYLALLAAHGPLAVGLVVALLAAAQAPVIPAADVLTTEVARRDQRLDYGRIRVFGSIAFLVTNVAAGAFLAGAPPDAIVAALAAFSVLAAATAFLAPAFGGRAKAREAAPAATRRLPRALLWLLLGAALAQASHGAIYAFATIHWRGLGFSGAAIGLLWGIGVVAEIVLFWRAGRKSGAGHGVVLIAVGGAAGILRHAALSLDPGLAATFLLQALHGLTFGATHLGVIAALAALSPPGGRGRAQGLYATATAFALALATLASGWLYEAVGGLAFLAMAPLSAGALACALIAGRILARGTDEDQPQSAGSGGNTSEPS